ncbi:MAG: YegS/Rv2252/BmrU family lipid kinase [Candidatus Krumholzibacteriia bacterium]
MFLISNNMPVRPCTHVETAAAGDAARAAEESARSGCGLIVAVGGDGTVQEVASGIARAEGRTVLAHVPTGTTNATARALGIPSDVDDAIASIEDGHSIELDAGFLPDSGSFFLFMTTIGAPARMIRDAPREKKDQLGFLAYVFGALRTMWRTRRTWMDVEVDGRHARCYASGVIVANIGEIADLGLRITEDSDPSDGQLDIVVVRARNLWEWSRIAGSVLLRRSHAAPRVYMLRGRTVNVVSRRPTLVQADGEIIGKTPVKVEIREAALRFLVPRKSPLAKQQTEQDG